ncbi:ATP-binding cassette domain-containing protein [Corynebacterium sp. sy017]|uniref:ATP-binding cassette domain-containing protein n=1 Tax=unclassified Corynebacterium TaxID=2624378 RepID=UPI001185F3FD|nr:MULTISPECIES: ATP-binding cassette domain-containing protein [unclassified Corynebacterium]MBP3089071.1 ATP-binding cassette domain-containing protein [Corynebacterium sp. sy017]TSD91386.1 ATP-binding cassette domain-containing protein [Corynebacterium sp. SY003]
MAFELNVENVSKSFGKHNVLSDINLSVPKQCVYALLGVNGAGKSTLMKGLVNLLKFDSGSFAFTSARGKGAAHKVGSLIESPKYYPSLSAEENLSYLGTLFGLERQDYRKLLMSVGLDPSLARPVKNYSLGMKQRFGLAVALMGDPEFLILDEPTNGLDPQGVVEMRQLIQELPKIHDVTIMVSSHILSEMQSVASHVGILDKGHIRYSGELGALLADEKVMVDTPEPDLMRKWLADKQIVASEVGWGSFWVQSKVELSDIIFGLASCGIPIDAAYVKSPSLEEKFFELTTGAQAC